jgi:hypothetical protein
MGHGAVEWWSGVAAVQLGGRGGKVLEW